MILDCVTEDVKETHYSPLNSRDSVENLFVLTKKY